VLAIALPREFTPIIPIRILSFAPGTFPEGSIAIALNGLTEIAAAPIRAFFMKLLLDTMVI
jgi:hypothetical protein